VIRDLLEGREEGMKRVTLLVLSVFVLGMTAAFFVCPKQAYSAAERRRLSKMPEFSAESILDGSYTAGLETYLLDHFPLRETLRGVKAGFAGTVLMQKENNGIYIVDGHASKLEYPLNEAGVERTAETVLSLKARYFPENRVFYTVIPDKNYFLAEKNGYPHMDYQKMLALLETKLENEIRYIDIIPALTVDDYYKSDAHWKQECIGDVAALFCAGMGCGTANFDLDAYQQNQIEPFYGVYRGQAALPFPAEEIVYLTNEITENATVYDAESDSIKQVYQTNLLSEEKSLDAYDIYLGGARAVLTIQNPLFQGKEEKRLILFRDSFGSSLAPLLIEQYSQIVLVDLRYISAGRIGAYVDFEDADILFAYNTVIWNHGSILRK